MRLMAINLIMNEKIKTTKTRAKQTAILVEKMITKAKKNDLAAKKALTAALSLSAARKLVAQIAPRFKDRAGGYTRVIAIGSRQKDAAPLAMVELLDRPIEAAPDEIKGGKKKSGAKKTAAKKEKTKE